MNDLIHGPFSRRVFLGGALATSGLILAGCSTSGSAPVEPSGSAVGRQLRAVIPLDVLPPQLMRFNPSNRILRRTVYDNLLERKPDGSYAPVLAESWEWSSDGKTLALNLRNGVTYHSGRDFGADDVVFSIKKAMDPKTGVQAVKMLNYATDVSKSGKSQVTVKFDAPFAAYLDALAMFPIVDSETIDDVDSGKTLNGTGPFTWDTWTPGSKIVMGRNDSYWDEGKPYVDGVDFSIISEPAALLAAMQSGQQDLAFGMLARDAATLGKNPKFTIDATAGVDIYVGVSTQYKPMDDIRVRQAVAYSIDRDRIAKQVYQGFAEPSAELWDPNTPGVTKDMVNSYSYNPDKARALLKDAGALGAEIEFAPSPQDPAYAAAGEIVQYGLEQSGLKIKRVAITQAEWPKRNQGHDLPALWLSNIGLTSTGVVPTMMAAAPLTPAANTSNFVTPEYTSLVNAVISAGSDAEVKSTTHDLTAYMVKQAFHNSIVQAKTPIVSVKGVTGVTTDTTLSLGLADTKIKE